MSEVNNFVFDTRGYNAFLHGEASEFLVENDPRLLLNTIVTNITYDDNGVIITNQDGSCISAEYTIVTFSVGVLQSGDVRFTPALPEWKDIAIQTFQMGVYTNIAPIPGGQSLLEHQHGILPLRLQNPRLLPRLVIT